MSVESKQGGCEGEWFQKRHALGEWHVSPGQFPAEASQFHTLVKHPPHEMQPRMNIVLSAFIALPKHLASRHRDINPQSWILSQTVATMLVRPETRWVYTPAPPTAKPQLSIMSPSTKPLPQSPQPLQKPLSSCPASPKTSKPAPIFRRAPAGRNINWRSAIGIPLNRTSKNAIRARNCGTLRVLST